MKLSSLKKDIWVLVVRLLVAETVLGIFIFSLSYFFDLEAIYADIRVNNVISFDLFGAAALIAAEAIIIVAVFWRWQKKYLALDWGERVREVIDAGEGETTEFKQTLRWDVKEQKYNKELEKAVVKNVSGFLNADGGVIVIGVTDSKELAGLEDDYKTLPRANKDGWENHFNQLIKTYVGLYWRRFVRINFVNLDGYDVCSIDVRPSDRPAYFKDGEAESFYVRTGNSTNALSISEATEYIRMRWKSKE